MGEYASTDMSPGKSAIRVLDNNDSCPGNIAGEVHYDSTLFSGGLWKTRKALGSDGDKKKFDVAVYKAMRSATARGNLGYGDFVNLVIEVLKGDLPASATALESEMTTRGVLPVCTRVFDAKSGPINPPSASGFGGLGFTVHGTSNISGKAKVAPGSFQGKVDLDRATKVTVAFTSRSEAAPAGGVFGGGGTPFAPVLFVKYNEPLQWTTKGTLASNADQTFEAAALTTTGIKSSVEVEVPEGTSAVYVQVGNTGQSDGRVGSLTITTFPAQEAPPPVDDPGVTTTTTTGGCACATAAQASNSGPVQSPPWLAAFGLAGVVAAALRRKRPC
jgi:MYXO-CTERM domain-containing protein